MKRWLPERISRLPASSLLYSLCTRIHTDALSIRGSNIISMILCATQALPNHLDIVVKSLRTVQWKSTRSCQTQLGMSLQNPADCAAVHPLPSTANLSPTAFEEVSCKARGRNDNDNDDSDDNDVYSYEQKHFRCRRAMVIIALPALCLYISDSECASDIRIYMSWSCCET